jgi:hypothetical protein
VEGPGTAVGPPASTRSTKQLTSAALTAGGRPVWSGPTERKAMRGISIIRVAADSRHGDDQTAKLELLKDGTVVTTEEPVVPDLPMDANPVTGAHPGLAITQAWSTPPATGTLNQWATPSNDGRSEHVEEWRFPQPSVA